MEQTVKELVEFMESLPRKAPQNLLGEFSRGELFLLKFLSAHGGTACPSAMSEALQTSTARIAAALNSLEHKGFITREPDAADRRRKLVHLTQKGIEYVESHRSKMRRNISKLFDGLGEKDTAEYLRIMKRMAEISRDIDFDE